MPKIYETSRDLHYEKQILSEGEPNIAFIKKHNLDENSYLDDWLAPFIPRTREKHERGNCSIDTWCSFTNLKALLMNAGSSNSHYTDFTPFTTDELTRHLALCFLQGISLSPRVSTCYYLFLINFTILD